MKKVLIILSAVTLIAVGCTEKKGEHAEPEHKDGHALANPDQTDQQAFLKQFEALQRYFELVTPKCKDENVYYRKSGCSPACSTTCNTAFNVKDYVIANNDIDKTKLAKWLEDNGDKICFDLTDAYIECIHRVDDATAVEILNTISPIGNGVELQKIKTIAENHPDQIDYKKDYYQHYVHIFIDGAVVEAEILPDYDPVIGGCFSMPFLRILGKMYGEDLTIQVKESTIYNLPGDTRPKKFIGIYHQNEWHYYDFSQIPTIVGGPVPMLHYGFSPL